jgi:A/G-specific adenine glycosylase
LLNCAGDQLDAVVVREYSLIMLRGRELATFRKQLLGWFRQFRRDLPWRRNKDPYRIWLSEIMLQQTRVAAVIPYYERFLERFPDVYALSEAPQAEVLRLWSGLGYYSRARNLHKAAHQVIANHGGQFPLSEKDVRALPGIGRYTADAILSIAFGAKQAVLDGNVARVLSRIGAIRGDLQRSRRWLRLQKIADGLLDPASSGDWNQAVMELGAMVCTPKSPQCLLCPVAQFCQGRKLGIAEFLPEKRKKRSRVGVTLAVAVFRDARGNTLLLAPPPPTKGRGGDNHVPTLVSRMWHFPTISVEGKPAAELTSYLEKTLLTAGSQDLRLMPLAKVRHAVTYREIVIHAFRIEVTKLPGFPGAKTLALEECSSLPISSLTRKVARAALAASAMSFAGR